MNRLRRWLKYRKARSLHAAQQRVARRARIDRAYQSWSDWYDAQVKP